jgi:hypothetical protein
MIGHDREAPALTPAILVSERQDSHIDLAASQRKRDLVLGHQDRNRDRFALMKRRQLDCFSADFAQLGT